MIDNPKLQSLEAEAAVLASMVLDPAAIPMVRGRLCEDDFYTTKNRILFQAICRTADRVDDKVDCVSIRDELTRKDQLGEIGGIHYIVEVLDSVPSAANVEHYVNIVLDRSGVRALLQYSKVVQEIAFGPETAPEKLTKAESQLHNLLRSEALENVVDIRETIQDIDLDDDTLFISTGYKAFDGLIYGFGEGDMIIIAGRPGMGKTALMLNMAYRVANTGKPVLFVTLEMTASQLQQRLLSSIAKVDLKTAQQGYLVDHERGRISKAKKDLSTLPLIIDGQSNLTLNKLRTRVASLHRRYNFGVVFVDYLQRMATPNRQTRYEAITDISAGVKDMGVSLEIPFVLGAQLSRAVENRDDKHPRLSDLRDSGGIEQDADVVAMLYRQDYYNKTDYGEAELIVEKNRRGRTGTVNLSFVPEYLTFKEI